MAGLGAYGRVWGMWQGVGACGRGDGGVWGHVTGVGVSGMGSGLWHGWRHMAGVHHVAGCWACGRVWAHVAGDRGLSQWIGVYGRGWGHVAGCGGMWHGVVACGRVWGLW